MSPAQARAVALLAQGYSITHAAADAGVHRATIHSWLIAVAPFQSALKESRTEFAEHLKDELRDLSTDATPEQWLADEMADLEGKYRRLERP